MDYNTKLREARQLIDKGMYTQAVFTVGNLLENLYTDFYQLVLNNGTPAYRKSMVQREAEFTAGGDKAAREKGFAGLTLGGKQLFFDKFKIIDEAEKVLGRKFPRFKAFDPQLLREMRNEVTHGGEVVVDEDEATLFYSQVRILLLETGLIQKVEATVEAVATGGLRSWKENGAIPHDDILGGNLQMDTYAADLWSVARGDANTPVVYRDPVQFFQQTYLTRSLQALLGDVLKVLGGGAGDRVLQLRTPFGGGKTHTLIALYHITKNRESLKQYPELASLPDPGSCAVAAVQCEKFDPRKGRTTPEGLHIHTLWGEIAYQLAGTEGYEYLRDSDEHGTSPGGETIATLLRDLGQPTLILLDEILNHVETAQTIKVGDSTLGRQLMIFLKNLTEAVSASRTSALVYSLQASVREAVGAENLLATLDHLVSRLDAKREPVSGGEVMRVVQRRLFREVGDEKVIRQIAQAYAEAYRKVRMAGGGQSGDDQHQAAQDAVRLAERIVESYPFHPDLLDLMYHRWGSLPSYQRTRGALQFLASVVYDLWERGRDLQPLISVGDVPLEAENTRNAFFTQVGQRENYNSVMDVDLIGAGARAGRVDRRIASDSPALQRFRVGTRLANGVMLYSFGAREGEERGVSEPELLQAAALPGLDRMPLTTALSDLRTEMLYLHYTGRRYRFETTPNLNKMIEDEKGKLDAAEVRSRVLETLEKALRSAQGAVIWPDNSGRVNDHVPMLQVAYLPLAWMEISDDEERLIQLSNWLEWVGNSLRAYKNAVVFALPSWATAENVLNAAREVLAIEIIERDRRRYNIGDEQLKDLKTRKEDANGKLSRGVVSMYDRVALPVAAQDQPFEWRFVELQSRNETTLHERVMGALRDGRLAFDTLTPDKLISLISLSTEQIVRTNQVVDLFFSVFSFTRLTSEQAIAQAIARGVSEGKLGYTAVFQEADGGFIFPTPERVYLGRPVRADEVDLADTLVLDAEVARQASYIAPPEPVPEPQPTEPIGSAGGLGGFDGSSTMPAVPPSSSGVPAIPQAVTRKRYRLVTQVDKTKIFKVFRVVQNLTDKSDRVLMQIEVVAEADGEFDPVWLRNAVEEPLDEADIAANTSLE